MNRGGLLRYILKRLLIAVPVLIGITLIDYLLMNLAGNPIDMLIGPRVTEAAKAAKMAELGLDQPFLFYADRTCEIWAFAHDLSACI